MDTGRTELEGHAQMSAGASICHSTEAAANHRELCLPESGDDADRLRDSQNVRQPGLSLSVWGAKACIFYWLPTVCSREVKFMSLRLWRATTRAYSVETGSRREHCSP